MRYPVKSGTVDLSLEGSRLVGYLLMHCRRSEIAITYIGMGGGGVGAACMPRRCCGGWGAGAMIRGGKVAGSTIWLPRMQRVLIGVDDTDTTEEGATWALVHNIAKGRRG